MTSGSQQGGGGSYQAVSNSGCVQHPKMLAATRGLPRIEKNNVTGCPAKVYLGGGFKYFMLSTLLGEDSYFDYSNIFQMG